MTNSLGHRIQPSLMKMVMVQEKGETYKNKYKLSNNIKLSQDNDVLDICLPQPCCISLIGKKSDVI